MKPLWLLLILGVIVLSPALVNAQEEGEAAEGDGSDGGEEKEEECEEAWEYLDFLKEEIK